MQPDLDGAEIFSGVGNIRKIMQQQGLSSNKYEIFDDPADNASSKSGAIRGDPTLWLSRDFFRHRCHRVSIQVFRPLHGP